MGKQQKNTCGEWSTLTSADRNPWVPMLHFWGVESANCFGHEDGFCVQNVLCVCGGVKLVFGQRCLSLFLLVETHV